MVAENNTLISELSAIDDPRIERPKQHKLLDILAISICAAICGAETWDHIAQYGESKHEWLKTFLELPNAIPSHDTFRRVFISMETEAFRKAFLNWIDSIKSLLPNEVISIDGKTL